jgi:hypothetical protein
MKSVREKRYLRSLARVSMRADEFRDVVCVELHDGSVRTFQYDGSHFVLSTGERVLPKDPEIHAGGLFYGRIFDVLADTSKMTGKQAMAVHCRRPMKKNIQ